MMADLRDWGEHLVRIGNRGIASVRRQQASLLTFLPTPVSARSSWQPPEPCYLGLARQAQTGLHG